jgi:hypothetical protein
VAPKDYADEILDTLEIKLAQFRPFGLPVVTEQERTLSRCLPAGRPRPTGSLG